MDSSIVTLQMDNGSRHDLGAVPYLVSCCASGRCSIWMFMPGSFSFEKQRRRYLVVAGDVVRIVGDRDRYRART